MFHPDFEPIAQPAVPVAGSDLLFPVRRIFCVARNYAGHAREMGQDPDREPPFFFTKPADAAFPVLGEEGVWRYPLATRHVDHEIELVVALGSGGVRMNEAQAAACVWGYALGLDMTRRDLQAEAKAKGRPWDVAKGFDDSAPISPIVPVTRCGVLSAGSISLEVNGEERQHGDLADMIWNIPETIAYLSHFFELKAGDLVFTGTPEGVAPVLPGDRLLGRIAGLGELYLEVVAPAD
ncbi:MAG: fumarylacetoacetate hydrolase family protein [Zoogloea sp.]|nr:fumarylacetoacetate hydrolase family protein [Zoogloea sp.]